MSVRENFDADPAWMKLGDEGCGVKKGIGDLIWLVVGLFFSPNVGNNNPN